MKKAKRVLAVLMATALLCGFAALGVSAADAKEPAQLTDAQMEELAGYMQITLPIAILEAGLQRVPGWLNWAVFANGSSYAAMEADLQAELKKAGLDYDKLIEWLLAGEIEAHGVEVLAHNKVLAGKGPDIVKKHCAFYIDWLLDCFIWASKISGGISGGVAPLFA
ncbi:MAG: hypothetical protein LBB75_03970 [Oscillospiraceae bacterium]|nr:hypothetical protein [Oscillospiraceae bacterium]